MCGGRVLEKHYLLGRDVVARNVTGDFVECGVCNGGSAAAFCALSVAPDGVHGLYDSFEGMPATKEVDGPVATTYVGKCVGSENKVREAMGLVGYSEQSIVIRKGWFEETFAAPLPTSVALLHVDCDWYESVMLSLRTFYDLVPSGGVIVLDDFGHWEGCREAFYDFVLERKLKPLLERFGYTQAFWVKERKHNREFKGRWKFPDCLTANPGKRECQLLFTRPEVPRNQMMGTSHTHRATFYAGFRNRLLLDYVRGNGRTEAAIRHAIRFIPASAQRILDLGCGIGWSSRENRA